MKVKCKDKYYSESITIGKEYILMGESETHYAIINDDGYMVSYDKKYFEPMKVNSMKIKEWKELGGKTINGYVIAVDTICEEIDVRKNFQNCIRIYYPRLSTEQIITQLKPFGIDVEFEKGQTITQNDYNFIEIYCNNQDEATITKTGKDGYVFIGSLKMPLSWKLFESLEYGKPYFVSDLRKFRVEG
jgi:hypothetical protein